MAIRSIGRPKSDRAQGRNKVEKLAFGTRSAHVRFAPILLI